MKNSILFFFLCISLGVSAQVNYFLELSGNLSLIPSSEKSFFSDMGMNDAHQKILKEEGYQASYNDRMGGDIMVGLSYFVAPKVSIETGLDFNLLRFKQTLDKIIVFTTHGNKLQAPSPEGSHRMEKGEFSLFYLNLPLSIFYHLGNNRFAIGAGFIPSLFLGGKDKEGKMDNSQFQRVGIGMQGQLRYRVTENVWIISAFQYFNTKIYKSSAKQGYSHNRLVKLGLRYDF